MTKSVGETPLLGTRMPYWRGRSSRWSPSRRVGDDRLGEVRRSARSIARRCLEGVLAGLDDAVADEDHVAGVDRLLGVGDGRPGLGERAGVRVAAAGAATKKMPPARTVNGSTGARLAADGDHDRAGDDAGARLDDDPIERARCDILFHETYLATSTPPKVTVEQPRAAPKRSP